MRSRFDLTTSLYCTQQILTKQWEITQFYNKFFEDPTSQLFKLHAQLDRQVMPA